MNPHHSFPGCGVFVAAFALLSAIYPARAVTRTWDGSASGFWTNAANWSGNIAPTNSDGLIFPANGTRLVTTNTFPGATNLTFISFTGSNYFLYSPSLSLTNGLTNAPAISESNTILAVITTRANQTWSLATKTILTLESNLSLSTFALTVDAIGSLDVNGNVTGSGAAQLLKDGLSRMTLNGTTNNIPDCRVLDGTLIVNGVLSGGLSISNGATISGEGTVPPFTSRGFVSPGGSADGVLTVSAGTAVFNSSSTFRVDIDGDVPGVLYDQLKVSSPPNLSGANLNVIPGISPPVGTSFVIITNTGVSAFSTTFTGLPEGATQTGNNIRFIVSYVGGNSNDVTLTVDGYNASGITRTWSGAGTNSLWQNKSNWVGNVAPTQGDDLLFPAGAARVANTNDFPNNTAFNSITINSNNYVLRSGQVLLNNGVHGSSTGGVQQISLPLTFAQAQTFTNSGSGAMVFDQIFSADTNALTIDSGPGSVSLNATILNAGPMTKRGSGRLTLNAQNMFPSLLVSGGEVIVNGAQALAPVVLDGGTLGGTGSVGVVTVNTSGTVNPGASTGILTCSNMTWNSNTTFFVEINGATAGSGYDQLKVNGTVNLGNATLAGTAGYKANVGTHSFMIITNDGADAVVGTFAGLPQGAKALLGGLEVSVSYTGGNGNDVVLTAQNNYSVWDGGAAPGNTNWSNATNWVGNVAPVSGDGVLFPEGSPGLTNFNDLANGFFIRTVRFDGSSYNVLGTNRLDVWTMQANHTNGAVSFLPTLNALLNPLRITNVAGGTLNLNGDITHAGSTLEFDPEGTIVMNHTIGGSADKKGGGVLRLMTSNSFPAYPSSISIEAGTVQALHNQSLSSAYVVVYDGARLELLNGRTLANVIYCEGVLNGGGDGSTNSCTGTLTLAGTNSSVNVASNSVLTLAGTNSALFRFLKNGPGQLFMGGQFNTLLTPAVVEEGNLFMNVAQQYSDMTVNSGAMLGGSGQVASLTNTSGGIVSPGADTNSPGIFVVNGTASPTHFAVLQSGSIFRVKINGATPGSGHSQLWVGGPLLLNNPTLELVRTFTPAVGQTLTVLDKANAGAITGTFAGLAEGATFTNAGVAFQISYVGGNGNDVTLTRAVTPTGFTRVWTGAGTNRLWSNPTNWVANIAPVSGDSVQLGDIAVPVPPLSLTNDLVGLVLDKLLVASGSPVNWAVRSNGLTLLNGINASNHLALHMPLALPGDQVFTGTSGFNLQCLGPISGGNSLTLTGAELAVLAASNSFSGPITISCLTRVDHAYALGGPASAPTLCNVSLQLGTNIGTLAESALTISNTFLFSLGGTNAIAGRVTNVLDITPPLSTPISYNVAPNSTLTLLSNLFGNGGLDLTGGGTLILNGTNNFDGTVILVEVGTLRVDGFTTANTVFNVFPDAVLAGSGTVGRFSDFGLNAGAMDGVLSPGSSPGILRTRDLKCSSDAVLRFELNGTTAGTSYDQVSVTGWVNLGQAQLETTLGFTPTIGNQFTIIANDAAEAVTNTFNGLPQGTIFTNAGIALQISYTGGSGNDVVLTALTGISPPPPPAIPLSSGTYTQNFNSLSLSGAANTWSNGLTLFGWYAAQSASPFTVSTYRASDGTDITGALYSFGSTGNGERALGSIASGTPETISFGLCFTNDTPTTFTNFAVAYTGEQWRSGGNGSITNTLTFWYRVNTATLTNPEPVTNLNWTVVSNLNFSSPTVITNAGALNGNQSTNQRAFYASIPGLAVPPGQNVFFRWLDANDAGSDQGVAVDDLTVTFTLPPRRITSVAANPTNGSVQITAQGETNASYVVEAATNLVPPVVWQSLATNAANGSGVLTFIDTNAPTFPTRFYRIRLP